MPRSSAVVVLTRVYVASPRHTLLSAACGSFDYRRLPPPGVAPCILLLLRAVSGGPGLLIPPARSKIKAQERHMPTYLYYDTPCSSFAGHPGTRKYHFHQVKPHATRTDTYGRSCDIKKTRNPTAPKAHPLKKHF